MSAHFVLAFSFCLLISIICSLFFFSLARMCFISGIMLLFGSILTLLCNHVIACPKLCSISFLSSSKPFVAIPMQSGHVGWYPFHQHLGHCLLVLPVFILICLLFSLWVFPFIFFLCFFLFFLIVPFLSFGFFLFAAFFAFCAFAFLFAQVPESCVFCNQNRECQLEASLS